jgi:hypothetical protein
VLVLFTGISGLRAALFLLGTGFRHAGEQALFRFYEQLLGALCVWLALPVVLFVVLSVPRWEGRRLRFMGSHVLGFLIFALAQVTTMLLLRQLIDPFFGVSAERSWRFRIAWSPHLRRRSRAANVARRLGGAPATRASCATA